MQLPQVLKPFQKKGEKLLKEGKVKQTEFSGGTYQVQVDDEKAHKEVWSFLQLDENNSLKDSFCSCEESEDVAACPHLVASYLHIFNQTNQPLHKRFEKSLWNKVCHLYSDRLKFDPTKFKHSVNGTYAIYSGSGKQIFVIKGKTKEASLHIKDILFNRLSETEETSLKFSNLPQEEIIQWREGRPSLNLSYELSFWSDLAKWMMSLQDNNEKYSLTFDFTPQGIPNYINMNFDEFFCKFYISEANLPLIIPALSTVKAPLQVHDRISKNITKIIYDKENGCLITHANESSKKLENFKEDQGFRFGSWMFLPDKGFYPLDPLGIVSSSKICGEELPRVLNENYSFIKEHLEGTSVHEESINASYAINFDNEWNLHINAYVLTPGDLQHHHSRLFGEWAYLDGTGFYKINHLRFKNVSTIVPSNEVGDFIQHHRSWLNMHEGFETHLASIEAQLTYKMASERGPLSFHRTIMAANQIGMSKDFGSWIYLSGQGFYAKTTTPTALPVRPGIALNAEQIPTFIRTNREELKMVVGFFSEENPVIHAGLDVSLDDKKHIIVKPYYDLLTKYEQRKIGFFDEFTFVEGEGFSELPSNCRLPIDYRTDNSIDPNQETLFLNYELPHIKPLIRNIDFRLQKPKKLTLVAHQIIRPDPNVKGLYSIKLGYFSELGEVLLSELWLAIKKKQRFCFSPAGLIDLEDSRFEWLHFIDKIQINRRSNTLNLSTIELIRLNAFDHIEVLNYNKNEYQKSLELLEELTEFQIPENPILTGLNCTLRPYQQVGLQWLWFLYHHGLSGLLCDDMGLGKTHQAMALFAAIINEYKKMDKDINRHFLIVCPTSVIYHWQDKLAAFLPDLRVCTFYGSNRSIKELEQYDILLTSYGIWRMEHELLSQIPFEVAVLDEIQIAKNHNSRIHASFASLNAQMRLGLTGTPIENHLRELKSLFDIVLPSYMPGEKNYREFFIKPIEKEHDPQRKILLSRLIHPFVLRRKKEDVLVDLPEKIEEISHCGLLEEQARMYNEVVERSRKVILDELKHDQAIPYIHIFAILSYLKQICDHPACYLKQPENYKQFPSGKWDLFIELLNEARESQQKVVVYSQYLNMLDIMQNYLTEAGIDFASIRGSTTNRGEELKRFSKDPNCEVFLGSLQAAGLGIELTAANVVIHYDRWWNAARENQATDRVHRIGQTRGVQVFKLVTKGTFEEKIDAMIARKGKLMEDIVGVDDHRLLKHFNREEIIELLQSVTVS